MTHLHLHEPIHKHKPNAWYRLKASWPFFVWIAAAVAGGFLYWRGSSVGTTSGIVESVRQEIAPIETAPLQLLRVQVGSRVRKGDIVAEMDASVLGADLAVLKLQTELQFEDSVARIESEMRDARMKEAEARGEFEVLSTEVARLEDLLAKHLVDAQSIASLKARENALARLLEIYPQTLQDLEKELKQTHKRAKAARVSLGNVLSTGAGDESMEDGLNLLKRRRESYILRANRDGIVSEIYHRPGNVVAAGLPIATVVEEQASSVIGFLPEFMARDVNVGMTAYLTHTTFNQRAVKARIVALAPDILSLPARVNPVPGRVYRGRRIVVEPIEPNDFFPGESVNIQFERPVLSMLFDQLFRRKTEERSASSE
ncbi:MAG TPA: hypothetical protein DCZ95_05305 [Verrucomicrobia bacterium]|nr:MAG: hypothetical protein A2X46_10395 [Lentisphaerae bacterium GWF2_57_35]HBA83495.1 hypothetical protein [Verrucomicrobiota bacterium]